MTAGTRCDSGFGREQQTRVGSLSIADRGYVLSTGRVVLEGKASELIRHEELRKAYLGR
jgi:branched-chain amino acid transport system ATP-binding protein